MRRPPIRMAWLCLGLLAVAPLFRATVQAAITVTERYAGDSSANVDSYTSNSAGTNPLTLNAGAESFAIASGSLLLCYVTHSDSAAPPTAVLTHDGDTLTQIGTTVTEGTTVDKAVSIYYVVGPQSASFVAVTTTGNTQTGMILGCYEIAGVNTASPIIRSDTGTGTTGSSHTVTMGAARTAGSVLVHVAGMANSATHEYAGVGTESSYSTPTHASAAQWDIGGPTRRRRSPSLEIPRLR